MRVAVWLEIDVQLPLLLLKLLDFRLDLADFVVQLLAAPHLVLAPIECLFLDRVDETLRSRLILPAAVQLETVHTFRHRSGHLVLLLLLVDRSRAFDVCSAIGSVLQRLTRLRHSRPRIRVVFAVDCHLGTVFEFVFVAILERGGRNAIFILRLSQATQYLLDLGVDLVDVFDSVFPDQ